MKFCAGVDYKYSYKFCITVFYGLTVIGASVKWRLYRTDLMYSGSISVDIMHIND
jgi:hypothetical protein